MNKYFSSLSVGLVLLLLSSQHTLAQTTPSPVSVMRRVANKLASVKLLGYKYTFTYNYPARDSRTVVTSQAYLDLQPVDRKDGFKFQFKGEGRLSVYNGSEYFIADEKTKKLHVDSNPAFDRVGDIILQNSPLTLKYALPKIVDDKKVEKKLTMIKVHRRQYYVLEFSLTKSALSADGSIFTSRADQTATYRVSVDKSSLLPVEVLQTNDKNDESLQTVFAQITEKPIAPKPPSWYYSAYKDQYQVERKEKLTLIEAGKASPDFKLAGFGSTPQTSLDQYKGKLLLIEFWIAHCGFCIAAVPKLNDISQRFAEKGLHVVSINMHDPATTIEYFKSKNKPQYVVLTDGESVARPFGVAAYPAIVLIDGAGRVAYSSSGLFEKDLEAAIVANLAN